MLVFLLNVRQRSQESEIMFTCLPSKCIVGYPHNGVLGLSDVGIQLSRKKNVLGTSLISFRLISPDM